jgi:hypothetical protein
MPWINRFYALPVGFQWQKNPDSSCIMFGAHGCVALSARNRSVGEQAARQVSRNVKTVTNCFVTIAALPYNAFYADIATVNTVMISSNVWSVKETVVVAAGPFLAMRVMERFALNVWIPLLLLATILVQTNACCAADVVTKSQHALYAGLIFVWRVGMLASAKVA